MPDHCANWSSAWKPASTASVSVCCDPWPVVTGRNWAKLCPWASDQTSRRRRQVLIHRRYSPNLPDSIRRWRPLPVCLPIEFLPTRPTLDRCWTTAAAAGPCRFDRSNADGTVRQASAATTCAAILNCFSNGSASFPFFLSFGPDPLIFSPGEKKEKKKFVFLFLPLRQSNADLKCTSQSRRGGKLVIKKKKTAMMDDKREVRNFKMKKKNEKTSRRVAQLSLFFSVKDWAEEKKMATSSFCCKNTLPTDCCHVVASFVGSSRRNRERHDTDSNGRRKTRPAGQPVHRGSSEDVRNLYDLTPHDAALLLLLIIMTDEVMHRFHDPLMTIINGPASGLQTTLG